MSLRPVNRIKHVIDNQFATTAGTTGAIVIIQAHDDPSLSQVNRVLTGSKVNGIYLRVEAYARTDAALANFYLAIFKNVGGNLVTPAPNTIGSNDNKRYVIHQEMVMLERSVNGNPRTVFNGVVVLPRGMRRMGPNDQLLLVTLTPGVDTDACMQCHYKEFR